MWGAREDLAGCELGSIPAARQALETAARSGEPATSGLVVHSAAPGIRPVDGLLAQYLESRNAWVVAVFDLEDMLRDVPLGDMGLAVHDGPAGENSALYERPSLRSRLTGFWPAGQRALDALAFGTTVFRATIPLTVGDRSWTLEYAALPEDLTPSGRWQPVAGLLIGGPALL